jgi:ADP-ribose pyrophosphatase YjhB (NUDIX family)
MGALGRVFRRRWRGILTTVVPSYYRDAAAPSPNVPRRVGVIALIERDGVFLVERRVDDRQQWAFVGGNVEEDEQLLDGLHREVREETGFEIEHTSLLGLFSDPTRIVEYPDGTVCRILSVAFHVVPRGDGEPVPSSESAGMEFVTRAELADRPLWPAHLPVREALLAAASEIVVA